MATTLELESLLVKIIADATSYLAANEQVRRDVTKTTRSLGILVKSVDNVTTAFTGTASGIAGFSGALQGANLAASAGLIKNLGVNLQALVSGRIADKLNALATGIGKVATADITKAADAFNVLGKALKTSQLGLVMAGRAVGQIDALVSAFAKIASIDAAAVSTVGNTIASTLTNLGNALYITSEKSRRSIFTKAPIDRLRELSDAIKGLDIKPSMLTNLNGLIDVLPRLRSTLLGLKLGLKTSVAAIADLNMLTMSLKMLEGVSPTKIRAIMDALGGNAVANNLAGKARALSGAAKAANAAAQAVANLGASGSMPLAPNPMWRGMSGGGQVPYFMRPSSVGWMTGGLGRASSRSVNPSAAAWMTGGLGSVAPIQYADTGSLPMPFNLMDAAARAAQAQQAAIAASAARRVGMIQRFRSMLTAPMGWVSGMFGGTRSPAPSLFTSANPGGAFPTAAQAASTLNPVTGSLSLAAAMARQRVEAALVASMQEKAANAVLKFGAGSTQATLASARLSAQQVRLAVSGANITAVKERLANATTQVATTATRGSYGVSRLTRSFDMLGRSALGARTNMNLTQLSIAAFAALGVAQFAHFDTLIERMLARMGDYRGQFRVLTSESVMNLSGRSITSTGDIANSLGILSASGMNVPMALQAMPIAESLAVAGSMEMELATRRLVTVLNNMGTASRSAAVNLAELTRISDIFVRASQLVDVTVEDMSQGFSARFTSALRQANLTMQQGAGLLMAYNAAGVRGAEAGERGALLVQSLERSMSGARHSQWASLGLSILTPSGHMKSPADIIEMLENRLRGLNPVAQQALLQWAGFDTRVTQTLYPLLGLSGALRDYTAAMHDVGGTTEAVANMIRNSFGSQIVILWNNIKNLAIDIGRSLAPAIGWLARGMQSLSVWFRSLDPYFQKFIVWTALVVSAMPLVGMAIASIGTVFGFVATGVTALMTVLGLIGVPLSILIASAAAVTTIIGGWSQAGAVLAGIWNAQLSQWDRMGAVINRTIGYVVNFRHNLQALDDFFTTESATGFVNFNNIVDTIRTNFAFNVGVAMQGAMQYLTWFKDNFDNILIDIGTISSRFWVGFVNVVGIVLSVLRSMFTAFWRTDLSNAIREGMSEAGAEFRRGMLGLAAGNAAPTGRYSVGMAEYSGGPGGGSVSTQGRRALRDWQLRDMSNEDLAIALGNTGNALRRPADDPLITARTREGLLALADSLIAVRQERRLISNLPDQITAAMRIPASDWATSPLPNVSLPFRGLTDVRLNSVIGQRKAQLIGMIMAGSGIAMAGQLGGAGGPFLRTPDFRSDFNMQRRSNAMANDPLMRSIVTGLITSGSGMAMFGEIMARQILPMYRGNIIQRGEEGLDSFLTPSHAHTQKFEQMSFNRFMLGGPEQARAEQTVRAPHIEGLINRTNQELHGIRTNPPPAVAGH